MYMETIADRGEGTVRRQISDVGAYLVISEDDGAAVDFLCFARWSVAVAL